MLTPIRIAVDAMGGDNSPKKVIDGIIHNHQKNKENFYKIYEITSDFIELRNLVLVARIIIESAIKRKESRGLHYTIDYPELNEKAIPSKLSKDSLRF